MPTFTAIALENFLEPRVQISLKQPLHGGGEDSNPRNEGPRHLYIPSPSLYATPEQAPIPYCSPPEPLSPSPYVVNLKRRRAGNERRSEVPEFPSGDGSRLEEDVEDSFVNRELAGNGDEDEEGFLDPRSEAMSVGSEVEASDFFANQIETRSVVSAAGEFFDADDEQLSHEIVVTRLVAEAVGRGEARARAEEAAAAIIESKDQEILRLKDRLQYSETVNHEMSQRKLVEVARRQQERKQSRRQWLRSLMGLSIAIGVSFVAYKYIPQTSGSSSADSTDAPCINSTETS